MITRDPTHAHPETFCLIKACPILLLDSISGNIIPASPPPQSLPPLAATLRLVQVRHTLDSFHPPHSWYATASVMIDHFPFCKECVEIESIYIVSNWSLSCSKWKSSFRIRRIFVSLTAVFLSRLFHDPMSYRKKKTFQRSNWLHNSWYIYPSVSGLNTSCTAVLWGR